MKKTIMIIACIVCIAIVGAFTFLHEDNYSIGIIGGADGPTSIFIAEQSALE